VENKKQKKPQSEMRNQNELGKQTRLKREKKLKVPSSRIRAAGGGGKVRTEKENPEVQSRYSWNCGGQRDVLCQKFKRKGKKWKRKF